MTITSAPTQQQHMQAVIDRYTQRTAKSKAFAAANRAVLADKSSIGFNFSPETKEACYPVVAERSHGSKLWDIDGNEYIDILMGLGTNLFGHNPAFIREAIEQQLKKGIQIGPQSELVGETAQLACELTGMERVTFSSTGTEAVMTAVRIARTATNRSKIAVFTNSYHGHFDAGLMRAPLSEYARKKAVRVSEAKSWLAPVNWLLKQRINGRAVPAAMGIPSAIARDIIVLEYGNPKSLSVIKANQKSLAAVLVEPVQSRCPELQPQQFLTQLRTLTEEQGTALIFDEMVTGFRVEPGGAQAYFGISADIAAYSKIAGGGLPLSIIAGKSRFMDHIDGGQWQFGDNSSPQVPTTFFAGTFCKHPLSLASAHAALTHLKAQGPSLQAALNQKTKVLVERLNQFTIDSDLPVRFTHFGSFFAIALTQSQISLAAITLLSYHLLNQGIHLRSGDKGGFLSTAHKPEDIEAIYQAFETGLLTLKSVGYLS
ncbi:aspartate aminotransferase family protein [cf. Phormidesmis sp. LEGE 11477]|uniref:aspartate aminotransferase family protein n=1 Tax=cf. Phormidesmis sp. LEGE 11477 TaxID=1828680 RepID=UPI00187DE945|nr:aspartate aminotransferase family protein [cf. Phormidesmis sp. LEGE 11477]MBE9060578.1 aspartate aminotransferase family protein [cf. Phormidesmis sp. LEGE 11477]